MTFKSILLRLLDIKGAKVDGGCTEIFMQPPHISRLIFAYAYIIIYA